MKASPKTRGLRILNLLPPSADVREEVRVASHQMRLLLELLGVCEKVEQHLGPGEAQGERRGER